MELQLSSNLRKCIRIGIITQIIILTDLLSGSSIRILDYDSCFQGCLASKIIFICLIILLLNEIVSKKKLKIRRTLIPIILVSAFVLLVEPGITDFQYQITNNRVERIKKELENHKNLYGEYPVNLKELKPKLNNYQMNSAFGIFFTKIQFEKISKKRYELWYRVKFNHYCSGDENTNQAIYTCVRCY